VPARFRTEKFALSVAVAAIALHVLTDAFITLEPATTRADHLLTGGLPFALLVGAVTLYPRLRPGARAALAVFLGALSLAGFGVAFRHATTIAATGDDWTAFALLPSGLFLLGLAAWTLWRSRRREGHRYVRRGVLVVVSVLATFWIVLPTAVAVITTHRPREAAEPVDLGRPYETEPVRTSDGLTLDGRYVPSRNGAAIIVFPGSNSRAPQARALSRHGYGVLMLDMRGHGQSDGDPNAFGWGARKDIDAGVAYLHGHRDVKRGRVGGIGFSVGGEQMLEAAASNLGLRAIISDGAGERSVRETTLRGPRGWLSLPSMATQTLAVAIFSGDPPPPALRDLVPRIAPRPVLFIYAGRGVGGEELQPEFYAAAGEPKFIWKIPEADHTGGFSARPREYEHRVVSFFDRALLTARAHSQPQKGR
jgi:pimeloyl-ACP methyl ester carboxylesterase